MEIGKVIRENRKRMNMTQEQMAKYLGVTAPAVNKWEKQNSFPDITLLSPLARLLNVSLETLLSHHDVMSTEAISEVISELNSKLKNDPHNSAFDYAKLQIQKYPNCFQLIWQLTVILDSWVLQNLPEVDDSYSTFINNCYIRVLDSDDKDIMLDAANSLFLFHISRDEFELAESYLQYFPNQSTTKREKQAFIYSKTGRYEEAFKIYEELLFANYQLIQNVFGSLYIMAQHDSDVDKAYLLVEKQCQLAKVFDMGVYNEIAPVLDYAISQKNVELTLSIATKMLKSVASLADFSKSSLYGHLNFQEINGALIERHRKDLISIFGDRVTFEYMKDDNRWENLIGEM